MTNMFKGALVFNQPIGDWNVSSVTSMGAMFYDAKAFNQPIGNWETGSHLNSGSFDSMFNRAFEFDQDLTGWCVDKVSQIPSSFADSSPIDGDLTKLPVWGTCS